MNIQIIRTHRGTESTLSTLIVDKVRRGHCLEDIDRGLISSMPLAQISQLKIYGRTCIPTGRYKVAITYSERFGRRMPQLLAVPGYGGIRLHKGNYIGDTLGCPLPGRTFDQDKNGYYRVWESGVVYEGLLASIIAAELRREPVWCEVSRVYKL